MTLQQARILALTCLGLPLISGADGALDGRTSPDGVVLAPYQQPEFEQVVSYLESRNARLVAGDIDSLARVIVDEAAKTGLEPQLILALIQVESSGNRHAVSRVGAMGLMQLRPSTAQAVASDLGIEWRGPDTLFDPLTNVRLGVAYLNELIERFGDVDTALAAYNWGPTRIARMIRLGGAVPAGYVQRVRATYETLI